MVIKFKSFKNRSVKKKYSKFLYTPLFFESHFFWLERVVIKKSFNGQKLQITSVTRAKEFINKEMKKSTTTKIRKISSF